MNATIRITLPRTLGEEYISRRMTRLAKRHGEQVEFFSVDTIDQHNADYPGHIEANITIEVPPGQQEKANARHVYW